MAIYFKNGGQSIARLWHSTSPGIQNSSEQRRYFIICLILLAHGMDPDFPLIVAANRDEFFDRPSEAANFWQDQSLSFSPARICRPEAPGLASPDTADSPEYQYPQHDTTTARQIRGELVRNFLSGTSTPLQYCESIQPHFPEFAGSTCLSGTAALSAVPIILRTSSASWSREYLACPMIY